MARNDGRIEPGQKLSTAISARAWNRAQEAADRVLGAGTGATPGDGANYGSAPYTFVYAKNNGVLIERWGVLQITGLEVTPTNTPGGATAQFEQMPVLACANPVSNAAIKEWCVAIEPISTGKIGRVAVAGVVQIKAADLARASGSFVIWKNDEWALIRIGGSGVRLGTISGGWSKGGTAVVTEQNGDGTDKIPTSTFLAKNYFVTVSGNRRVACAKADDTWILIAAEC